MYLKETFWLCLVVMVRMYICSAASRSAASYFSSGPNRSRTTSLQLCGKCMKQSYIRSPFSGSWGVFYLSPSSNSSSRESPLSWNKLFCNLCGLRQFSSLWWSKYWTLDRKRWLAFLLSGCFTWLIIKEILRGGNLLFEKRSEFSWGSILYPTLLPSIWSWTYPPPPLKHSHISLLT